MEIGKKDSYPSPLFGSPILLSDLSIALIWIFAVSLGSNATPFFGASYTLLATAELFAIGFTPERFVLIVFTTALGATIAKIVIYSGSLGLRKKLLKSKNVQLFGTWLQRRTFYVGLFVAAFIPALPLDDYVYIGAGANRARLLPLLLVTFVAKLAKSTEEIYIEFTGIVGVSAIARGVFGLSQIELSLALSVLFVAVGIILYKFDWTPILKRLGLAGRVSS